MSSIQKKKKAADAIYDLLGEQPAIHEWSSFLFLNSATTFAGYSIICWLTPSGNSNNHCIFFPSWFIRFLGKPKILCHFASSFVLFFHCLSILPPCLEIYDRNEKVCFFIFVFKSLKDIVNRWFFYYVDIWYFLLQWYDWPFCFFNLCNTGNGIWFF